MKPLSPGKYYLENKKKFFTLFIILALSVALVSFVTSLITAVTLESSHTNLDPLKKMSLIMPSSNEIFIKDSVYDEITNYGEVKYAIKASITNTSFQSIVGNTSSPVVMLDNPKEDLNTVMQEMGFKLKGIYLIIQVRSLRL